MNNDQFRRLLLAKASKSSSSSQNGASPPQQPTPSHSSPALGSKLKSSIPMTPRSVAGARVDFARQLAERNQAFQQNTKTKSNARTSAPKGSKLAEGYVDRARTRAEQEEEDERAAKLKELEERFKKEDIDQEEYDRLRGEIAGGDLGSTHLVKGLDFKLLERVRRGEDVFGGKGEERRKEGEGEEDAEIDEDADDVLEQLEGAEVKAIEREKVQKKGQFATMGLNPGQKRTRNQILAEMKAARAAAKAKQESSLGSKFKKIGQKKEPGMRIERDGKGREVMIIVDEDGHERRKVRRVDPKVEEEQRREEEAALRSDTVLGMEVPEFYKKQLEQQAAEEEAKEISIFDDAGSDYDPLAELEGSDSSSEEEGETKEKAESRPEEMPQANDMPPPPLPSTAGPKNWFKDSKTGLTSEETYKSKTLDVKDPAFIAALQKAKKISATEKSEEDRKAAEREERLQKKLLESKRDDDDLDMGFGSSRIEDEADLDETKVKLSAWGEDDDDEDGGGGGKGGDKSKRKRGSKKRKEDKNSFADVMKVIERNKNSG